MKKTEAINRAKEAVPAPTSLDPAHYIVRVPADVHHLDCGFEEVFAPNYLAAQHARAYAICRLALVYMGLEHVPLSPEDGGTVEQLMAKALDRAEHGCGQDAPLPFWRVKLGPERQSGE